MGSLVLFLFLLWIIKCCIKKLSIYRQNKRAIAWLSTIPSKKFQHGDPYETCAICFEDYAIGDELRLLYCSHGNNHFQQFVLGWLILFFFKICLPSLPLQVH